MNILALVFLALLGCASVKAFDQTCNSNLAVYWGQDSVVEEKGGSSKQQKNLASYCEDDTIDVIPLAFLYTFFGKDGLPILDLANTCGPGGDPAFSGSQLVKCPSVGKDIKTCQSKGKLVTISLGGGTASDKFSSDSQAKDFADQIWNLFLGGSSDTRPFGDAILDGVDLDIESGHGEHYNAFVAQLRSHFDKATSKKYYLTAAPQCVFPDAAIGTVLNANKFDAIYVQFYNNNCGADQYGKSAFNFATWDNWARTKSPNPEIKVYIGVAAAAKAAEWGYVDADRLATIIKGLAKYKSFGGVMMWDASEAAFNNHYDQAAKKVLNSISTCSGSSNSSDNSSSTHKSTATHKSTSTKSLSVPTVSIDVPAINVGGDPTGPTASITSASVQTTRMVKVAKTTISSTITVSVTADAEVPTITACSNVAEAWSNSRTYAGGEEATYNGHLYVAKWWSVGDKPTATDDSNPWEDEGACTSSKVIEAITSSAQDCTGVAAWDKTKTYTRGKKVVSDGYIWEAQWWNQESTPGYNDMGVWEQLGACAVQARSNQPSSSHGKRYVSSPHEAKRFRFSR